MTPAERLAFFSASSHDPDTQTGCFIMNEDGMRIVGTANRVPNGVELEPSRLARPAKYSWIQHAELRAISQCAAKGLRTFHSVMYLNWFPCAACAQGIVTAGIKRLVADQEKYEARKDDPRYDFGVAMEILKEGGVEVEWL